ncbi:MULTISPECIES: molybdenum cofactor guanylyltransferase MobA [unclassified Rhizobium]|uniref:molybdenum cofactor guanylyltransferase MobA n=1 Tax=unclassified Rhizobium TaxID=2613769 RepID=UPI0006F63997|nr:MULTISPECIES: molybdenum cofactor guanylyltransferase MobA [unclassified Rhizobium]KQV34738.1 hypothetical protein ASC86_14575 [Rhizobium sp. Root1212]KRD24072.1 hypothetical protein ASE37_14570 [Rhizobium sp. Root268]
MQQQPAIASQKPPGFILAGGLSSRMGHPKALAMLAGAPLLAHVAARLAPQTARLSLNWNGPVPPEGLQGLTPVADVVPGHVGPLAGILTAIRETAGHAASHVATVPIDAPFFPLDLVEKLSAAIETPDDIAIAFSEETMHPVFGLWPVSLADDLDHFLRTDPKRRVRAFIERHRMRAVPFTPIEAFDPFFNVNTPEDLVRAEQIFRDIGALQR